MRRDAFLALLAALAVAPACGGGGGSGSGSQPAQITSANADTIASDVLGAIALSADLSTIGIAAAGGDVWPDATAAAGVSPARLALAAGQHAAGEREPVPSLPGGGVAPAAPVGPLTEDCEVSGTITSSGDVADPGEPTIGDRLTFRFEDCVHAVGAPPLNGEMRQTIAGVSGSLDSVFTLTLVLTFDDFSAGTGADRERIDGDATTIFDNTAQPLILTTARGFTIEFGAGEGDTATFLILNRFETRLAQDIDTATDPDTEIYDVEGDGQVESSEFTGSVEYEIEEQLAGVQGELPDEGSVLVTGDQSAMRIVVLDAVNVRLELDLDDDGTVDQTLDTTWELLGF